MFPDSTVTDINLDDNGGMLVWDIELDDGIRSVDVNAITGAVLSFGYEANDNNSYMDDAGSHGSDDSYDEGSNSSDSYDDHNDDHNDDHDDDEGSKSDDHNDSHDEGSDD